MGFIVKYVATYQTSPRILPRHQETYAEKEFDTKWEAEKFLEEWKRTHWYASNGLVKEKVIDTRSQWQIARDERESEKAWRTVHRINGF